LFGCSSTPKIIPSIVLSIDRNPTISFNSTAHRDATIKLQFQKIKFSEISMVYRDDIKSQSGLTYRNFLEITIPSNTDDTAVINISFKNDIPECDFTSFHLYLQAVSNDIKSNEIFISVFLVQQNLSDIFTQTDLGAFIISPTEPEILNKAIALNPKYNPNEFDNESLSIILISNQSAKLSCSDQDL
jgi:hypothetical protein